MRITNPNSQQFNMDCDVDNDDDNEYGADDDGDDDDDNGDDLIVMMSRRSRSNSKRKLDVDGFVSTVKASLSFDFVFTVK